MSILPIGRITSGVQEIGNLSGTPAAIVQLLSKPETDWVVQCTAFSTLFEDPDDYPMVAYPDMERPISDLLRNKHFPGQYSLVGEPTLAGLMKSMKPTLIVLTGSEPCGFDITKLLGLLKTAGKKIQIETRGTCASEIPPWVWVTLRTAPARAGTLDIDMRMARRANEIVAKIYTSRDIDDLEAVVTDKDSLVWIMPARAEQRLYSMCVDAAASKGWRVVRPSKEIRHATSSTH